MASDRYILKQVQQGHVASVDTMTSQKQAVADSNSRVVQALCTDGGTAATAVTEEVIFIAPRQGTVRSVNIAAPVAVTASDTTYATFTVSFRDANGANSATVATQTTKTSGSGGLGNLTAFKPATLTLTAANANVAAGAVLTLAVAKASTGVAIASATAGCLVTVDFEEGTV